MQHSPFLILLFVVFVAFLGLLALLSLAVTKSINPDGRTSRGPLAGLATAFALLFLCGAGALGAGALVATSLIGTAIDKNPIERIDIRRSAPGTDALAPGVEDRRGPLSLSFTVRGNPDDELLDLLRDVVDLDAEELEDHLTVHHRMASDGSAFHVYEFRLPDVERELNEIEREIERELHGVNLRLPESVAVLFEGAERYD